MDKKLFLPVLGVMNNCSFGACDCSPRKEKAQLTKIIKEAFGLEDKDIIKVYEFKKVENFDKELYEKVKDAKNLDFNYIISVVSVDFKNIKGEMKKLKDGNKPEFLDKLKVAVNKPEKSNDIKDCTYILFFLIKKQGSLEAKGDKLKKFDNPRNFADYMKDFKSMKKFTVFNVFSKDDESNETKYYMKE